MRLLESEEFEDAERDRGVKTHPSLVGTDGVIKLNSPGTIGADVAGVILPAYSEDDDTIGFRQSLQNLRLAVFGVLHNEWNERLGNLLHRLVEFRFARIPFDETAHESVDFGHRVRA